MVKKRNVAPPASRDESETPPAKASTLHAEIALRAYYRHCARGRATGSAVDDWLAAEQEVLAELRAQHPDRSDIN